MKSLNTVNMLKSPISNAKLLNMVMNSQLFLLKSPPHPPHLFLDSIFSVCVQQRTGRCRGVDRCRARHRQAKNLFVNFLKLFSSGPLLLTIALLILHTGKSFSQEMPSPDEPPLPQVPMNQRSLGDQALAITAGVYIPLFTILINDWDAVGYEAGAHPTNLNAGGAGALTYSVYLSNHWKIGFQFGGSFSQDINSNFVYSIPFLFKGSYEFHPWSQVSIPVFISTGISLNSWKDDNFLVDWIINAGFGVYFDWSYEWSFGIDFKYIFIPQLGLENANERSIGNFMDITLTAEYHF